MIKRVVRFLLRYLFVVLADILFVLNLQMVYQHLDGPSPEAYLGPNGLYVLLAVPLYILLRGVLSRLVTKCAVIPNAIMVVTMWIITFFLQFRWQDLFDRNRLLLFAAFFGASTVSSLITGGIIRIVRKVRQHRGRSDAAPPRHNRLSPVVWRYIWLGVALLAFHAICVIRLVTDVERTQTTRLVISEYFYLLFSLPLFTVSYGIVSHAVTRHILLPSGLLLICQMLLALCSGEGAVMVYIGLGAALLSVACALLTKLYFFMEQKLQPAAAPLPQTPAQENT